MDNTQGFDGKISSSGFSRQNIEIFSTRPKKVDRGLNTFFNLAEEAVEQEIEEHKAAENSAIRTIRRGQNSQNKSVQSDYDIQSNNK